MQNLLGKMRYLKESIMPSEILNEDIEKVPSLVELVNKAKEEWLDAKYFFEEVTDPDLVDHAIYRIESAEKKYIYLLKLATEERVINNKVQLS